MSEMDRQTTQDSYSALCVVSSRSAIFQSLERALVLNA